MRKLLFAALAILPVGFALATTPTAVAQTPQRMSSDYDTFTLQVIDGDFDGAAYHADAFCHESTGQASQRISANADSITYRCVGATESH